MIYKITKIERKTTSTGKLKADLTVVDTDGKETVGVTVWADYPNFATLDVGHTTEGDVVTKVNGQFTNHTLYPARTNPLGFKKQGNPAIAKAVEAKNENIKLAQENKQEGVKLSATFRDATLLTVEWIKKSDIPFMTKEDVQKQWLEWRTWLMNHFDDTKPF